MVDLKSELTDVQAEKAVVEKEVHDQLLQLHAVQLQLHAKTGQDVDSGSIKAKLVSITHTHSLSLLLFQLHLPLGPFQLLIFHLLALFRCVLSWPLRPHIRGRKERKQGSKDRK